MRSLLVLGATGFLGAEVVRAATATGGRVVAAARRPERPPEAAHPGRSGRVEARRWDGAIPGSVEQLLADCEPESVLSAVALSRVGDCDRDPATARRVNAELPGELARACGERGLRLVHVSTDLVFGGAVPAGERYREDDPPSPLHVYGRTKADGEARVLEEHPGALVVRLPLLFGDSRGRGLGASDALRAALERGESPLLFTDEWRTPLDVGRAARALLELVELSRSGLLHVAGPERLTRHELGALVVGAQTLERRCRAGRRADLGMEETRPRDVSLDASLARSLLSAELRGPSDDLGPARASRRAPGVP